MSSGLIGIAKNSHFSQMLIEPTVPGDVLVNGIGLSKYSHTRRSNDLHSAEMIE